MTRKSALQKQYQKERTRIKRLINRYTKLGIEVNLEIPKVPKRITSGSISRLKKITPEVIRKKSQIPDLETGEVLNLSSYLKSGKTLKEFGTRISIYEQYQQPTVPTQVTKPSKEIPPEYADVIYNSFTELTSHYSEDMQLLVKDFLNSVNRKYGGDRTKVAEFLQETYEAGLWVSVEDSYKSSSAVFNSISQMLDLLHATPEERGAILSSIDSETDFYEDYY